MVDWSSISLSFGNFKARGSMLLKGNETSEIIALLEDALMVLSSLMSNRYNAPFKTEIQSWVKKLSTTSEILEQWLVVQVKREGKRVGEKYIICQSYICVPSLFLFVESVGVP